MNRFLHDYFRNLVTIVHLLPFFPFSSDDGFSVVDYRKVSPALGCWTDVMRTGRSFALMFNVIINLISVQSGEFQAFLRGSGEFGGFFIPVSPEKDVSKVFRPRSSPLSTQFETWSGPIELWTTFSEDQADLNYRNPAALLYIIDEATESCREQAEAKRISLSHEGPSDSPPAGPSPTETRC